MLYALICAAGSQARWAGAGGQGFKQHVVIGGETLIGRTYRLACERCYEVTTIVRDPDRWTGINAQSSVREPWMGEMGKLLDGRAYWPENGEVLLLMGDVFYTQETLDLIVDHEPDQPTVYGRVLDDRRYEIFAMRFAVPRDAAEIERVARECADHGMNDRGGLFRWWYRRTTGDTSYSGKKAAPLATPANGFVSIPDDATDDFDEPAQVKTWRDRWGGIAA